MLTEALAHRVSRLGGVSLMDQAPLLDCLALDAFSVEEDSLAAAEIDVRGDQVAQALVASAVVVLVDESFDLRLEVAGEIVVFEQDAGLKGDCQGFRVLPVMREGEEYPHGPTESSLRANKAETPTPRKFTLEGVR